MIWRRSLHRVLITNLIMGIFPVIHSLCDTFGSQRPFEDIGSMIPGEKVVKDESENVLEHFSF